MVVIDDKQPSSLATEGSLPSSGLVKRMVDSISNQILNKQQQHYHHQIDEFKLKQNQTKNQQSYITTNQAINSKSVVSDLKKAIESNLNKTAKLATDDMPVILPNKSLITKLSANFTNENNHNLNNYSTNNTNIKLTKYNETIPYHLQETIDGIQIQIKQPHLISVIIKDTNQHKKENLKTSIRIYPLKSGRTTIGSSYTNDIIVNGPGIQSEHCFIENILIDSTTHISTTNKTSRTNQVTMYPLGRLCSVDGVLIDNPFKLSSGNMLCLGESVYFRYNQNLTEEMSDTKTEQINDTHISFDDDHHDHDSIQQQQQVELNRNNNKMINEINQNCEDENKENTTKSLNHELDDQFVKLSFLSPNDYDSTTTKIKPNKDKRTVRFNLPISNNDHHDDENNDENDLNFDISLNKNDKERRDEDTSRDKQQQEENLNLIKSNEQRLDNTNKKKLRGIIKLTNHNCNTTTTFTKTSNTKQSVAAAANRSNINQIQNKIQSTINKFELLSRGIKIEDESNEKLELNSNKLDYKKFNNTNSISSSNSNNKTNNCELDNNNKMLCSTVSIADNHNQNESTTKSKYLYLKEVKSKSFGCEKDLHNSSGNGSSTSNSSSTSSTSSTSSSSSSGMGRSWSNKFTKSKNKKSDKNQESSELETLKNITNNNNNKKKKQKNKNKSKSKHKQQESSQPEICEPTDLTPIVGRTSTSTTSLSIDLPNETIVNNTKGTNTYDNNNSINPIQDDTMPTAFHIENLDFIDDDVSVSLVCCSSSKNESTLLTMTTTNTTNAANNDSQPKLNIDKSSNSDDNNDLSEEDDYDDNVIYEGDSDSDNDEEDSQLDIYGDDNNNNNDIISKTSPVSCASTPSTITSGHDKEERSCRSAPVTYCVTNLNQIQTSNNLTSNETVVNSFIFDVDLYNKNNNNNSKTNDSSVSSDAYNKSKLCNFDSNDEEEEDDDVVVETYLSNSCNTSTSSLNNYDIKLEPLVIEEDKQQNQSQQQQSLKSLNSFSSSSSNTNELRLDPVDLDTTTTLSSNKNDSDKLKNSSNIDITTTNKSLPQATTTVVTNENTFSYSSIQTISSTTNAINLNVLTNEKPNDQTVNTYQLTGLESTMNNTETNCFNKLDEAAASLNDRLIRNEKNYDSDDDDDNAHDQNTENQIKKQQQTNNEDDSLVDVDYCSQSPPVQHHQSKDLDLDSEDKSESTCDGSKLILSESQLMLKDNYEKAKRERQLEQEQAELEKKRLQEILDICMEFQRQEQYKSENNITTTTNSSKTNLLKQQINTACQLAANKLNKLPTLAVLKQNNSLQMQNSLSNSSSLCSNTSSLNTTTATTPTSAALIVSTNNETLKQTDKKYTENYLSPSSLSTSTSSSSSSSINTNKLLNAINNVDVSIKPDENNLKINYRSTQNVSTSNQIKNGINLDLYSSQKQQDKEAAEDVELANTSATELEIEEEKLKQQQQLQQIKLQQAQTIQFQIEKLTREKCSLITCLNYLKQKIQDIEMRQNEAIRDLEMERALLDVEHSNQLKNIQNDEAKLKHLQQEHQIRIDAFNMHTNQIRNEIEMVQMTIKNVENEILILDTNLDTNLSGLDMESVKVQKQRLLEESKRQHEDLEFQLMELEAKYESELEDIQNRLIKEQDNLLNAFKQRQVNLNDYDQQQTQMLMQVKAETECLEIERQKLIEQFKKQRNQLHQIEKKLQKMQEQLNQQLDTTTTITQTNESNNQLQTQQQSPIKFETEDSVSSSNQANQSSASSSSSSSSQSSQNQSNDNQTSPSPASSSVSLSSSLTNSASNTPPPPNTGNGPVPVNLNQCKQHLSPNHQHTNTNLTTSAYTTTPISTNTNQSLTPNRYIPPNTNPNRVVNPNLYLNQNQFHNLHQMQSQLINSVAAASNNSVKSQQYKKQLSKSFRDILENTLLINGFNDVCLDPHHNHQQQQQSQIVYNTQTINRNGMILPQQINPMKPNTPRSSNKINKSTSSLEQQHQNGSNLTLSSKTMNEYNSLLANEDLIKSFNGSPSHRTLSTKSTQNSIPTTPMLVNTQLIMKFAELERNLAMTKAENNTLLEQQLQARERELHLLQEEKTKREELERQLNEEINLREKIVEENIKLRDKKQTQARPLTRYLPVRDNNFDLKQHVENSGHQLINQIDVNTKQPLIQINSHSCRGYLLKMGQKFKTWNKRWFVFDRQKRTLCYYMDKHETKLRGSIYFQSINEVYVDHMRSIKSPDSKSTFVVKTFDRNFYFVAPSSELMRIWVDVIFTGAEGYLEFLN